MNRVFRSSHAVSLGVLAISAAALVSACTLAVKGTDDDGQGGQGGQAGGAASPCTPGTKRDCYTGPSGTIGKGVCVGGTQTCNQDGLGFGECVGEVVPRAENCTTADLDEDCDGEALGCAGDPVKVVSAGAGADDTSEVGFGVATDGATHVVVGVKGSGVTSFVVNDGEFYMAKYDESLNVVWPKSYPSSGGHAVGRAVALDAMGNIVVAGEFKGSLTIEGTTLESGGNIDVFVAKFTPDGALLWAKDYGDDDNHQVAYGVAVNEAGEVFVTGYFDGSIDFGKGELTADGRDVFVAKIGPDGDGAGADKWAKQLGGSDSQIGWGIAAGLPDGSVVVTGDFEAELDYGGGTLPGAGGHDVFVVNLSGIDGNTLWQKSFGDGAHQYAYGVTVGANGHVAVVGQFWGKIDAGGGVTLDALSGSDAFVIDLAADGTLRWAKAFGDSGDEHCESVAMDGSGQVLMLGHFDGFLPLGSATLQSEGKNDIYVAKLAASDGTPVWSHSFGNANEQRGWSVAVDPKGNTLATGAFEGTVNFEPGGSVTSGGKYDLFLLELAP
ncbi:hypothetical protein [Polyangium aurulentum]|uniref:hypothetical protein n=1 Tax=Polyangium aurulentum TaxID=2567896 RepID=UPI0010AE0C55|nr:hypothetical protein [Polyangium aurulentum]UQA61901.1 hypothetical protein E8A73_016085 [Polyangium aurulentum]